jgi:ERF superfamily protein
MTEAAPTPPRARRRANGEHPLTARLPAKPGNLLEAIIMAASDPSIDIAKVEHLVRLKKEMDAAEAERLFNEALAAAQAQMQPVVADARNDQTQSRYASFAQVDKAIRPIYSRHGLSVTWTTGERSNDTAVEVVGYLLGHGHSRRYSIVMPADGKGPKGGDVMSRTHAAAAACSYAMRYLTLMMFNLAIDKDTDGNEASPVPRKSSAQLKREGVWPQFQAEMRGAESLAALQAVVERWRPHVVNWSEKWRGAAEEVHGQCHARLGGTMQALRETAERLDTPAPPVHWEG